MDITMRDQPETSKFCLVLSRVWGTGYWDYYGGPSGTIIGIHPHSLLRTSQNCLNPKEVESPRLSSQSSFTERLLTRQNEGRRGRRREMLGFTASSSPTPLSPKISGALLASEVLNPAQTLSECERRNPKPLDSAG